MPYLFTGKERDTESGLDYFGARYYASSMGRWMSPDPSGLTYADPTNPQSLNLYSYVLNNPLRDVDPNGLLLCDYGSSDTHPGNDYDDADNAKECTDNGGKVVTDNQTVDVSPPTPGTNLSYDVEVVEAQRYLQARQPERPDPNFGMNVIRAVGRQTQCIQDSLKKNGLTLALDAAGLVPGEGSAFAAGQYVLGVVAARNSASQNDMQGTGLGATSAGISAFNGIVSHVAESGQVLTTTEGRLLKIVPVVGTVVSGVATAHDASAEMKEIQACMNKT